MGESRVHERVPYRVKLWCYHYYNELGDVGFGIFVYRRGVSLTIGSVIGVILLVVCIWLGNLFPLALSKEAWMFILLGYIFVASVTPVWILLQPIKVSITDGLTQVFNHKYIIHRLEEECIRSERYDEDLSIVLLDLDYFKKVNDTYGHQCGDEVLRRVAETIEDTIRESDIVGRYGGEEFLIILPNTNKEACYQVANKIREAVSEIKFEQEGLKVTISGGVSTYMHFSYSQMIMSADMNLLSAKKNGKDRIE